MRNSLAAMRTPRSRRGILEQTTAAGARGKPDWAPRRAPRVVIVASL